MNLWFFHHSNQSGLFNVGTGQARSFNDLANALIALHGSGEIEYIPFPNKLKGAYQSFTEANIGALRKAGYADDFCSLEEGLRQYFQTVSKHYICHGALHFGVALHMTICGLTISLFNETATLPLDQLLTGL